MDIDNTISQSDSQLSTAGRSRRQVHDHGIRVDFDVLDEDEREDGSSEGLASFDAEIAKLNAEIEKMAPNLKALER